jgi:hypothetical protein
MGHADEEVGDLYSKLKEDEPYRQHWAERIGLGFSVGTFGPLSEHFESEGRVNVLRVKGLEVVGANGFEPSTSWSRTRRASQAALRPDSHAPPQLKPKRSQQLTTAPAPHLHHECRACRAFPPEPLLFNAKPATKKEPELKAEIKHHLSS